MKFIWKRNTTTVVSNKEVIVTAQQCYCNLYSLSETGPTRDTNEDSLLLLYPEGNHATAFAIVADGMGGHNAGEVASNIACTTAREYIRTHYREEDIPWNLYTLIQEMQLAIRSAAAQQPAYAGMGTTATTIFIRHNTMYYGHVGDSRLYHLRNQSLQQLTTDDTLVHQMMLEGAITPAEAAIHPMKNILVQSLGTTENITPQVSEGIPVQNGDRFFLCSDGIYDVLQPEELSMLLQIPRPELVMEAVKALCMQRMASDNFSAILVTITNEQPVAVAVTREQNILL